MSTPRVYKYCYANKSGVSAPLAGWIRLSKRDFRTRTKRVRDLVEAVGCAPLWADDLLAIARAVYLVDRRTRRAGGYDSWTRDLRLAVQVANPEPWRPEVLALLAELLRVLTADEWRITTFRGATPIDFQPRLSEVERAEEITLFSGGLDSSAYLASRARVPGGTLLWVGHGGNAARHQKELHQRILRLSSGRNIQSGLVADQPARGRESSSRSRGFLFAATAVFAGAAHGVTRVAMPENGQLAINPPLTLDRIAACSTRSVHPWVIDKLNRLVSAVGGNVEVHNPFLSLTKGEVCRIARDAGLTDDDLAATVSCGSHPVYRRHGNCGYCYPCLIRRSGLHASGGDPTRYQDEVAGPAESKKRDDRTDRENRQNHLADLQSWLARPFGTRDLIADMPFPSGVSLSKVTSTVQRGREEIAAMLRAHGQWTPF